MGWHKREYNHQLNLRLLAAVGKDHLYRCTTRQVLARGPVALMLHLAGTQMLARWRRPGGFFLAGNFLGASAGHPGCLLHGVFPIGLRATPCRRPRNVQGHHNSVLAVIKVLLPLSCENHQQVRGGPSRSESKLLVRDEVVFAKVTCHDPSRTLSPLQTTVRWACSFSGQIWNFFCV